MQINKLVGKLNPLTIILINMIIPAMNSIFPSDKSVIFALLFSIGILVVLGLYRKTIKVIVYILIFSSIYFLIINNTELRMLALMFKMAVLFLPCYVLAYVLITEYKSSQLLSSLQSVNLPKIFIIGVTVIIRYISTFKQEFKMIRESMYVRGVKFSLRNPMRTFEYIIVPQLFRCLTLSGELTAAGLTKGIDAPIRRSSYYDVGFHLLDAVVMLVLATGYAFILGGLI